MLEDVDVPGRRREVDVGRRGDGAADVVRCQGQVVCLGPAGQPAQTGEPAEVGEIGLDDNPVHRASRDIHAIANHAVNNWEHQALTYSRARSGLPPLPMF